MDFLIYLFLKRMVSAVLFLFILSLGTLAGAYEAEKVVVGNSTPEALKNIGIEERLGQHVDLTLPFISDSGKPVTLASYFTGHKPVLLSIVYFECPSLCNYHLNGVLEALKELNWTVGKDFDVVAVSMDSRETAEISGPKKANYVRAYGRPQTENGWHFLTGEEKNIQKLAQQVGFKFRWDNETQQFAHASAAIVVSPEGKISRYLHGIQPDPKVLRMALLEAGQGKIGSVLDQFVMFCFHFDPKKSKYTLYAWNIMRISALAMVLVLFAMLFPVWWRQRQRQNSAA